MQALEMFQNNKPVIAIDGTAGSGKGTLAKKLTTEENTWGPYGPKDPELLKQNM